MGVVDNDNGAAQRTFHFRRFIDTAPAACRCCTALSRHKDELAFRRSTSEQLVRPPRVRQRHALGNDGVDLFVTEQSEQRNKIFTKPFCVSGTPAHERRSAEAHRNPLMALV